jgi:tetraacyldisaccharide 4'-kinase
MIGALYSTFMRIRNSCFDAGILKSHRLPIPTISVGNLTVGGTGKTPIVTKIAEILLESGEKPCILTRGYGRKDISKRVIVSDGESVLVDASEAGDEPFEVATRLKGKALVIADRDRLSAGLWAAENLGATVAILDDGFQHRWVQRDLDIVCVDATDPFGNGLTLPFGKLREPLDSIKRADLVMITRYDLADDSENKKTNDRLDIFSEGVERLSCSNQTEEILGLEAFFNETSSAQSVDEHKNKKGFLFCAIGNPKSFLRQMKNDGFSIGGTRFLRDHSHYNQKEINSIEDDALEAGASYLLTTPKDAVKLRDFKFSLPCFVVKTRQIFQDESHFIELIKSVFRK